MFAYGPPEDDDGERNAGITFTNEVSVPLNQAEVNYHTFQEDQKLAFTGAFGRPEPAEEIEQQNLDFAREKAHDAGSGFGLPNYFGDLPGNIANR